MNADKAAELVNRKRREYGLEPVILTQLQKAAAYESLLRQVAFKGCSIETAIDATVKMHYQTHLIGRPL